MEVEFLSSKTGEETCRYQGVLFHSIYNPKQEAKRFVDSLETVFNPKTVLIFEPALSYCQEFLKIRFPKAKLCAIRASDLFSKTDKLWDHVFYLNEINDAENQIFNVLGEENLSFCLFTAWPVSAKIFQKNYGRTVGIFKNLLQKSHSILATRSYFETRWILNSLNTAFFLEHTVYPLKKTKKPVLICCSGPSLKPFFQNTALAKKFFIIAVSSAVLPLLENQIIPDLCVSTDGGFWAKKHVEILLKNQKIPIALACEGNAPSKILQNSPILPLGYIDGIETEITECSGINTIKINRNGTVSGTALELALSLSDSPIYMAGLDLALQTGFQHTQNNALETGNAIKDCKNRTKETRIASSEFSNQKTSLKMYEDWFSSFNCQRNIYRIIDEPKNSLGKIKDISWENFLLKSKELPIISEGSIFEEKQFTRKIDKIRMKLDSIFQSIDNFKSIFPLEYLQFTQAVSEELLVLNKQKLITKIENLKQKVERRFYV